MHAVYERLITIEQTGTSHVIHMLFMVLLFLLGCGSPRTMFVQICHEYNIVCKHTKKYFIGLGVTKENNKDPALLPSVETISCSGRIELELPRCTREPCLMARP